MAKKPGRNTLAYLLLVGTLAFGTLVGCSSNSTESETTPDSSTETGEETTGDTNTQDELVVIKYGTHEESRENPNYVDPVTGEPVMGEEEREMKLEALEIVKEELGVDFQFVQYPGDPEEVLLQSVMAGDPIADIVRLPSGTQGTILGQNVLQPLDDYTEYLGDEVVPEIYGGDYFIRVRGNNVHPLSPLMYNINYIEAVPGLKVDGKTMYPTDIYEMGEWTWSNFQAYLDVIDDFYANSQGPERPENRIDSYVAHYQEVALSALQSAGGSIYGAEGLEVDSPETIEGVNFAKNLIDEGLLNPLLKDDGTSNPNTDGLLDAFSKGEAVFTQFHDWRAGGMSNDLANRGESLGFIPFPRPDDMAFDDPEYRQVRTGGESFGILKGIEEENIPLAIQAYHLFDDAYNELYLERYGEPYVDIELVFDRMHPEVGEAMDTIYQESLAKTTVNELSNLVGVYGQFLTLVGDSFFGINGTPEFETAITADRAKFDETISEIETTLASGETKDNVGPNITQITPETYVYPVGTDLSTIDFTSNMAVVDNIDGELESSIITVDTSATDTATPGVYWPGLIVKAVDSLENEGKSGFNITIYNPDNTTAPTLTLKEEYRTVAVNEDVAAINWTGDFVDQAVDADGIPVKEVVADVAQLDTTTAGEYTVKLTATDHAGNTTSVDVKVVVE